MMKIAMLSLLLLMFATGCEAPGLKSSSTAKPSPHSIEPARIDTRDDIVSIVQFWPQQPWLREDAATQGFRVPTYFISAETEKGVFVSGTVFVWLYEIVAGRGGKIDRVPVQQWEFDAEQAMGFRVRKEALGGYYYGFVLKWDPTVKLDNKRVEIQFGYERVSDKKLVLSRPKQMQVSMSAAPTVITQPASRPAPRESRPGRHE